MAAGPEIDHLIRLLAQLPGLGPRSARRAALHMVTRRESLMEPLARAIADTAGRLKVCTTCGNIDVTDPCGVCSDPRRDPSLICVVEQVGDVWALERAGVFAGRYHVLGGVLSALDGIRPEDLTIAALINRARAPEIREVILALNATVDGAATSHYIMDQLENAEVSVTSLARGVPVGGELDYLDEGTLAAAMKSRRAY